MKRIITLIFTLIITLIIGVSCDEREIIFQETKKLTVQLIMPNTTIYTRSTNNNSTENENKVHSMFFIFFERSADGSGKLIDILNIDASYPITSDISNFNLNLEKSEVLNYSTPYNIRVVANMPNLEETIQKIKNMITDHKTEKEVIEFLKSDVVGHDNGFTLPFDNNSFIMNAFAIKETNQDRVIVKLDRILCRIDVINNDPEFTLISASIWNGNKETFLFPDISLDYLSQRNRRLGGALPNPNENEIRAKLYTFENYVIKPKAADEQTTCLIVGLKRISDNTTNYYRININPEDRSQNLVRNNIYVVTINKVMLLGANNEENAYTNPNLRLDYNINNWTNSNGGTVFFDGDDVLVIPSLSINFSTYAETRTYNLYTIGSASLALWTANMPNGITATLINNKLTIVSTNSDYTRKGSLNISFGNINAKIDINQAGLKEKFLKLSSYDIIDMANSNQPSIQVSSSGPWKATIYGAPWLSFGNTTPQISTFSGVDKGSFYLYKINDNTPIPDRIGFVVVSLEDNRDVSSILNIKQSM